jgi:hypothetical protein
VSQTADHGYIIAGDATFAGSTDSDIWVIKTDSVGDVLWERTFEGGQDANGFYAEQTMDGGYIVAGGARFLGGGKQDLYVIRLNSAGDPLWERTYGGAEDDLATSGLEVSGGGYIFAGETRSFGNEAQVYLLRTDASGNALWEKTYGGSQWDWACEVRTTSDGGYILVGSTQSFGSGGIDIYVVRTDSSGNALWETTYGGIYDDYGRSIDKSADGGYILGGYTYSFGPNIDVYLARIDSLGNTVWETTFGGAGDDRGHSLALTSDGGIAVAGLSSSSGSGSIDAYLVKTDSTGNVLWERTFGGDDFDQINSMEQTDDGGFILAGDTWSFGVTSGDIYLIKTDANGVTGVGGSHSPLGPRAPSFRLYQNSPNPFYRSTLLSYSLRATNQANLSIYDITGRLAETLVNEKKQPGVHNVRWSREANPGGVYFYRLEAGEFVETRTMVLLD